jgi:hypothetical protein
VVEQSEKKAQECLIKKQGLDRMARQTLAWLLQR